MSRFELADKVIQSTQVGLMVIVILLVLYVIISGYEGGLR